MIGTAETPSPITYSPKVSFPEHIKHCQTVPPSESICDDGGLAQGSLTEVFGRMSTEISGPKLGLWADFSLLKKEREVLKSRRQILGILNTPPGNASGRQAGPEGRGEGSVYRLSWSVLADDLSKRPTRAPANSQCRRSQAGT